MSDGASQKNQELKIGVVGCREKGASQQRGDGKSFMRNSTGKGVPSSAGTARGNLVEDGFSLRREGASAGLETWSVEFVELSLSSTTTFVIKPTNTLQINKCRSSDLLDVGSSPHYKILFLGLVPGLRNAFSRRWNDAVSAGIELRRSRSRGKGQLDVV
jgi:hypothetical protein